VERSGLLGLRVTKRRNIAPVIGTRARDKKATLAFMRKASKRHGSP
jgi:hypothetical protein